MNWHTLSLPLIVACVLLYHIVQKNIPRDVNPLVTFASAYLIASAVCLAFLLAAGEAKKGTDLLRGQDWLLIVLLGVSAIGVELGVLYAYRTGWRISTTSITTGTFTAISLALIGVLWFKEELTAVNVVGIALCLIGVVCMNVK